MHGFIGLAEPRCLGFIRDVEKPHSVKALHGRAKLATLLVICQTCPTFEPGILRCRNYGSGISAGSFMELESETAFILTQHVFEQDEALRKHLKK